MKLAGRIMRGYFGVLALGLPAVLWSWWRLPAPAPDRAAFWPILLHASLALTCLLAAAAWLALRNGWRRAQTWALVASAAGFTVVPFGWPGAIAGLVVFGYGRDEALRGALNNAALHTPEHGDGTSRLSALLFYASSWSLTYLSFRWLGTWQSELGLTNLPDALPGILHLPLAILLSILLHELGHVLGAWASEMDVQGLRVGPVTALRLPAGWTLHFTKDLAGGWTYAVPTTAEGLRGRLLFMIAGGPVGSMLGGSLALLLFVRAAGSPWAGYWNVLELLAAFCLTDAFCNLIPVGQANGTYSDGARLWQLLRGGMAAERFEFRLKRKLSSTTMLPAASWDSRLVEDAVQNARLPLVALDERIHAYYHYIDKSDLATACNHLKEAERLAAANPELPIGPVASEFAHHFAFFLGRTQDAEVWLLRQDGTEDDNLCRALCAIRATEGDLRGAREAWRKGWALVHQQPDCGLRRIDVYFYEQMAQRWFPDILTLGAAVEEQKDPNALPSHWYLPAS